MPRGKKGSGSKPAKKPKAKAAAPETPAAKQEQTMTTGNITPDIPEIQTTAQEQHAPQAEAAAPKPKPADAAPKAEAPKTKRVRFLASDKPGGSAPITIGVNDEKGSPHFHTFKREEEVVVPAHVLEVVDNAVEAVYERKGDMMIEKQVKRFPYQVVV